MDSFYDKSKKKKKKELLKIVLIHLFSFFIALPYFNNIFHFFSNECGPKINLVVMSEWEHGQERRVAKSLVGCPRGTFTLLSRYTPMNMILTFPTNGFTSHK